MVMTAGPWSPPVVNALLRMVKTGFSSGQIAQRLNQDFGLSISRNAVIGKALRLKVQLKGKGRVYSSRHRADGAPKPRPPKSFPAKPRKPRTYKMPHPIWSLPPDDKDLETYSLRLRYDDLLNSRRITQCRFMHGPDRYEVYCGNPTVAGSAWCERCFRRVYRGPAGAIQMPMQVVKVA